MPPVHRNERDHPQCHHPCLFQGYTPVQDMRLATDQRPPHRTLEISRERETGNMDNNKPGIKHSMNAPMPCEKQAVLDYVHLEETADDYSLHVLACKGAEKGLFYVAATTIRLILFEAGLLSGRRPPISRMCAGNLSYIRTDLPRIFWYLYVMPDEWSRKVVAWLISPSLIHEFTQRLIDVA